MSARPAWAIPTAPRRVRTTTSTRVDRWGWASTVLVIEAPLVACYVVETGRRARVTSWRWASVAVQYLDAPH